MSIDAILGEIAALPPSVLRRIAVKRSQEGLYISRAGMWASLQVLSEREVQIRYEAPLHEMANVVVPMENAVAFLVAIINRDGCVPIDSAPFQTL